MKINIYMHSGSDNHGCEALAVSTALLFEKDSSILFSKDIDSDIKYHVDRYCKIEKQGIQTKPYSFIHIVSKIINNFLPSINIFYNRVYKNILKSKGIFLQIGGDNYCYGTSYKTLDYLNQTIKKDKHNISVLFGASIEKEIIDKDYKNLNKYDLIIVRESITYNNLTRYLSPEKVKLYPDIAFCLPKSNIDVPSFCKDAIGVNISPLIMKYTDNATLILSNYKKMIEYILETTNKNIVFVPHVVNSNTDDRVAIMPLYNEYKNTGRVFVIEDQSSLDLKAHISQFSMFIGARTHSTIAAYSTCVPTLVMGYSVKSLGIAQDLFGTSEKYVLAVNKLKKEDELLKAYQWINENAEAIKNKLHEIMPSYISKASSVRDEIIKFKG